MSKARSFLVHGISEIVEDTTSQPSYRYHTLCENLKITHLTFSVDLLFFSKGSETLVATLLENFEQFCATSGFIANKRKCEVYFAGVEREKRDAIVLAAQIQEGKLPFRYLGTPLNAKRLSIVQLQPLIQRIVAKIRSWNTKFLSYGGRVQLIKSALYAIQNYQVFPFPKKVLVVIESICRKFIWTGDVGDTRKALVAVG